MRATLLILVAASIVFPGCGGAAGTEVDAASERDGGSPSDAGGGTDTGAPEDAGTTSDGGAREDTGASADDAGTVDDSGTVVDAGTPDDAGTTSDAGSTLDCTAMDAAGMGLCRLLLGYRWDGSACVATSGCTCIGTDCGALFSEMPACEAAYAGCSAPSDTFACGPRARCTTGGEYCEAAAGGAAGSATTYSCNPLPRSCAPVPTCASCFPRGTAGGTCAEGGAGELTVTLARP